MKKILTFSAMAFAGFTFSQSINVTDGNEKFSTGNQFALTTTIYENTADEAISEWKKVLKDFKYEKVKDNNNEVFGDNILIKEWGNNPVDIYTKFEEDKKAKTVKMSTSVDLGGTYLTSADKDKTKVIEKMMKDFAVKMTKEPITAAVKAAEKQQAKLEDDQKDLEKDNKNRKEDIEDYKKKIVKAEKEIIEKETAIEKKKAEVSIQKKVVDASAGAVNEQAKSSKNILEKLEGQQKDLEKDKKNLKEDIEDYNKKIKKAEDDIKKNEDGQVKKKTEIETQKKEVENVRKKLDAVN